MSPGDLLDVDGAKATIADSLPSDGSPHHSGNPRSISRRGNTEPELNPAARLSILRWTFAAALLFVLVLSMWPMPEPPTLSTGWDKTDHIATYFLLGCLGLIAWRPRSGRVLAGLVAYGGAIELLQSLVPSRVGDWQDVMANVAGVLLAAAAIGWSNARRTRSLGAERYRTTNG